MKSLRFWLVTMFAICSLSACGGGGGGGGGSSVATADIYVGAYSDSGVDGTQILCYFMLMVLTDIQWMLLFLRPD